MGQKIRGTVYIPPNLKKKKKIHKKRKTGSWIQPKMVQNMSAVSSGNLCANQNPEPFGRTSLVTNQRCDYNAPELAQDPRTTDILFIWNCAQCWYRKCSVLCSPCELKQTSKPHTAADLCLFTTNIINMNTYLHLLPLLSLFVISSVTVILNSSDLLSSWLNGSYVSWTTSNCNMYFTMYWTMNYAHHISHISHTCHT